MFYLPACTISSAMPSSITGLECPRRDIYNVTAEDTVLLEATMPGHSLPVVMASTVERAELEWLGLPFHFMKSECPRRDIYKVTTEDTVWA
jgi:hypothetical protein